MACAMASPEELKFLACCLESNMRPPSYASYKAAMKLIVARKRELI